MELPAASERVRSLHARMTIDEKLAQLVGYWVDQGDEVVAPMAGEMVTSTRYEDATSHGIGHLTRVYGTRPVDPVERAAWLWAEQRRLREDTRLGIPAIVHEECLTGLAAWKAATLPTPLAWGAAFDPELTERIGAAIGRTMGTLGIHQGLAPVLDVVTDPRWGRVDECIAEDPYVVGTIGTAYVRGLQSAGVHATLKHFAGYSASQAGRNHAPVHMGGRRLRDVILPPFEMAVRDGGVRSVMNSYAEIDGVPVASNPELLTGVLREEWGFDGTVVADYFSVAFLHALHGVAADLGEAAVLALRAGIDIELPTGDAFVAPLRDRLEEHPEEVALVDRAVLRVLAQKEELGLLDADFRTPPTAVELDGPELRALARRAAEESLVLLSNDGVLPLAGPRRIAVIGPNAGAAESLMGCYSFANHVLAHHPGTPLGFEIPTIAESLRSRFANAEFVAERGCDVEDPDPRGIADAARAAASAEVAVVVVGDRAGLFGRGTVGEGNDVDDLELPGAQRRLVEEVVATGTPTVVVVVSGRPYAIGWMLEGPSAAGAVVQAFFPGEEGGPAVARLLAGDAEPSGRLPVSLPRSAGAQPYTYLHPVLGGPTEITSADNTPALPFGHGLTYTTFAREELSATDAATDGSVTARVRLSNAGARAGTDVVQLYARDVFASVTRPVAQLLAYQRVALGPGETATVEFTVPASRLAFTGRDGRRIVEPGAIELWVGPSCAERETETRIELTGPVHAVTAEDARVATATVSIEAPAAV
ncbi:glycoside hydrolase family 3 N-terminal domain-containing protein [Microbacterium sp. M3]|uniref:Glycoside hydrolase family 3 N-terminal domain-containing protein n=1 Tax=Microbacterium arthrosphaerae TaxID=792652 RepID=A0ABU4H358_9MICO|nr:MULTISPECIES: glycoside hydrolase family 3 N-terminal domain-containing protein [Microbacterium]MDW4573760.1 glycoside hydrolase family 3 N-terminal domain-containing protein [Microbacterium arthrosphaerae]MDW7607615.1 glycoside hydrolase family 3 N-terminal domain-containing protein [Microbacterium sp. M3]